MIRIRFQSKSEISYIVQERGKQTTSQVMMDSGDIMHVEGVEDFSKVEEKVKVNVKADEWFICHRSEFRVFDLLQ